LTKFERWYVAAWYRDWLAGQQLAQGHQIDVGSRHSGDARSVARRAILFGTWNAWRVVVLPPLIVAAFAFALIRLGDHSRSAVAVIAASLAIGVLALGAWGWRALQIRRHTPSPASRSRSSGSQEIPLLDLSGLEIPRDDLRPLDRRMKLLRWVGALGCVVVAVSLVTRFGPGSVTVAARAEYAVLMGVICQELLWRFGRQINQAHRAYVWLTAVDGAAYR
jgi:hypothetical protein